MNQEGGMGRVSRAEWGAVALVALLQLFLLAGMARRVGVTVDEPAHLLSSHLYWSGQDKLAPRDMPPMLKIFAGSMSSRFALPVPRDHASWRGGHEWAIAIEMMNRMDRKTIEEAFFRARLPMLVFPVACGLLLWWWARTLWGPWPALAVQALMAFSPLALAHGALVKNDMAAAFGYLLFWYMAYRWWSEPSWKWAAWMGVGMAAALLAKLSMLVLPGVALVMMAAKVRTIGEKKLAGMAALTLVVPYLLCLAAYQFETRRLSEEDLRVCRDEVRAPAMACDAAQVFRVIPVARPMWEGVMGLFRSNDVAPAVYLGGHIYRNGVPGYFVKGLAVKTPELALVLWLCGLAVLLWRAARRRLASRDLLWVGPPVLYCAMASQANLQLGVRLVLPAIPFLHLLGGQALAVMNERWRRWACAAVVLLAPLPAFSVHPWELAYFNRFAGGPENGLAWLSDSNLDWGQSLRALRREVTARKIPSLKLSYFGTDNVWAYFTDQEVAPLFPPWGKQMAEGPVYRPEPGWYAISATLLTGQLFPEEYRDYYREFRAREPVARIGYSIFLYHIP